MLCLARVWSFQNSHLPLGHTWHNQAHLFVMCWSTCHYLYWERSFSLRLSVELTMLLRPARVCNSAACVPLRLFTCPSLLWRSYPAERNLCESEGWRKVCSSSRAIGAQTSLMDFPLQRPCKSRLYDLRSWALQINSFNYDKVMWWLHKVTHYLSLLS